MLPTMQDVASWGSTVAEGGTAIAVDTRDQNEYSVARIGGKLWMTKNLDLPGGTTLSHADTNVPENYSTTTTGFVNGNTLPASSTSGFSSNTTAYVYNSGSTTCGDQQPCYSYYSWLAATAGYNATSNGTSVNYDICPSGWRLPTQAELTTLKNTYTTGATLTASPFLGVYGGAYSGGSFSSGGSYGYYWSSTANRSSSAYSLSFKSSSADVYNDTKNLGFSIRCVAKTAYTLTYDANGGSGAPSSQSAFSESGSNTFTLGSTVPEREGLNFVGWSTDPSGNATIYGPGDTFTTSNTSETLYAVWDLTGTSWYFRNDVISTLDDFEYSINFTANGNSYSSIRNEVDYRVFLYFGDTNVAMESGGDGTYVWNSEAIRTISITGGSDATNIDLVNWITANATLLPTMQSATIDQCGETLHDFRGGVDIAYTTALINNQCWMTKNLDLPGGTTIYSSDSNITASSYTLPASSTSGFSDDTAQNVYNSNSTTCADNSPCYSYYTYAAATAGTNPSSGDATSDICPSGWRLPTKDEYSSNDGLFNIYSTGAALTQAPFTAVYTGRYYNGSFSEGGTAGYYWTATARGSGAAYRARYTNSSAAFTYGETGPNDGKRAGHPIRCILK